MYYVHTAGYVSREDFMNEAFTDWIRNQLRLSELADMLEQKIEEDSSLKDYFLPIEAANGYLTNNELQILNVRLEKYDHMTGLEAKKMYADLYLHQGQYVNAIDAYRKLLADTDVLSSQEHVIGDIWNNLGCAYARLHDFGVSIKCFSKAYRLNRRLESLQEAVDAACLSGNPQFMEELMEQFAPNAVQIEGESQRMEQLLEQTVANVRLTVSVEQQIRQWIDIYKQQCER